MRKRLKNQDYKTMVIYPLFNILTFFFCRGGGTIQQEVLDEINLRTECLMEMYWIVEQTASEKPDENQVNAI